MRTIRCRSTLVTWTRCARWVRDRGVHHDRRGTGAQAAEELSWDPRVERESITVSVYDGIVTLAGTVGSLRQKRDAQTAAERVHGVIVVDNNLDVRVRTEHRREDADLRKDVLRALALDDQVPATVDALVNDGFVTLVGTARWQHQREEAEFVAGNILTGTCGGRTSASANGERYARTTARTAGRGATCRTTTPGRGPTGGVRTGWPGSATASSGCVWLSRCGTGATRSSRSGRSA